MRAQNIRNPQSFQWLALMIQPLIWLAVALCAISSVARADNTLTINRLSITSSSPSQETLVLQLSEPATAKVFALENPARLVIDLPTFRWKATLAGASESRTIKHLRYARFNEDTSRIVLDLQQPLSRFNLSSQEDNSVVEIQLYIDSETEEESSTLNTRQILPPKYADVISATPRPWPPAPQFKPNKPSATLAEPMLDDKDESTTTLEPPKPQHSGKKLLVMIDAGHGGKDPGCIGESGTHEKEITFAYAKALKRALEETGRFRANLTRDTDSFIPLRGRTKIARKVKADIFISLHADTALGADARGLSLYSLSLSGGDKEADALAARENKADIIDGVDLSGASADVADILIDMALHDSMSKSKKLGKAMIEGAKKEGVPLLTNPQREAGFAVLKIADIPSVLVELGFLSHPEEERLLKTSAHQEKIIRALVRGIDSFATKAK